MGKMGEGGKEVSLVGKAEHEDGYQKGTKAGQDNYEKGYGKEDLLRERQKHQ